MGALGNQQRDVTLDQQIACVKRELTMRGATYSRLVMSGKMVQSEATREIETMRAVLKTLIQLNAAERFRRTGVV